MSQGSETMREGLSLPPELPVVNVFELAQAQSGHFGGPVGGDNTVSVNASSTHVTEAPVQVPRHTIPLRPRPVQTMQTSEAADLFASFATGDYAATSVAVAPIQLPVPPQARKRAVFAIPSRPKPAEILTDSTSTDAIEKTIATPFASQKDAQQSTTERLETPMDIRTRERLAVRRRQAVERHTNPVSHRAHHELDKPMVFHSAEGAGIAAREAANMQRQRIVRAQQDAFNEADQKYAMPRRWGSVGNAALTGGRTTSHVTEAPVVLEDTAPAQAMLHERAIEDENMPPVIQTWLRGVWNKDEQASDTSSTVIQVAAPLPAAAPVRRRITTQLIDDERLQAALVAAQTQSPPTAEPSDLKDPVMPDWLRNLKPSTEVLASVDADEELWVPGASASAALPPLSSGTVVPPTPAVSIPIVSRTPENIQHDYEVAFREAAVLVAQQEVSFTGGGVGRVESFVRWGTRWMGRAGDFVYNGLYGASNRARAERVGALESLQNELIAYASSEKADYGDQLDLVQAEQIHFSERVLELKEAEAQRNRQRGGWHAIMSNKYIVTAGMVAVGVGIGALSSTFGHQFNPELASNMAWMWQNIGTAAVSSVLGFFGGDRAVRASVSNGPAVPESQQWADATAGNNEAYRIEAEEFNHPVVEIVEKGPAATGDDVVTAAQVVRGLINQRVEGAIDANSEDLWYGRILGSLAMAVSSLAGDMGTTYLQQLLHQHAAASTVATHGSSPSPTHVPQPTHTPTHTPSPTPTPSTGTDTGGTVHAGHGTAPQWHHPGVNPDDAKHEWIWKFVSEWSKNPDQFIRHGLDVFNQQHPGMNYEYIKQPNGSWWVMYKGKDGLLHALDSQQELDLKSFFYSL